MQLWLMPLLLLPELSCTLDSCVIRRYFLLNQNETWEEARRYCKEKYIDLASIDNDLQNNQLQDLLNTYQTTWMGHAYIPLAVWIGLHHNKGWRWSWGVDSGFRSWAYPSESGSPTENCVFTRAEMWVSGPCDDTRFFVCVSVHSTNSKRMYVFVQITKTWLEAQQYCRSNYIDLAIIETSRDNMDVGRLTGQAEAWIGLHNRWLWSDTSELGHFTKWSQGEPYPQPDFNVTFMDSNGWWYAESKTVQMPFFCYDECGERDGCFCGGKPKQRRTVLRVGVQISPELNPEDPIIKEAVFDKINKSLSLLDLYGGFNLTWREQLDGSVFHPVEKKIKESESGGQCDGSAVPVQPSGTHP